MNRTLAKFLFYTVAIVLLVWTSSLTYSFLSMALPNTFWAVPLLGLVVFDVGMISWLFVFLGHAEGSIQRAVAIALTMFNFIGVGLMVVAEILLDGQQLVEAPEMLGTAAIWGIGIWTIVNVLGLLVFHLGDPTARREMAMQAERDEIFEAALGDLKTRRIGMQKALAEEISAAMMAEMVAQLRADNDDRTGFANTAPDILESGRQANSAPSAHNAPRHEVTPPPQPAGQGSANGHVPGGSDTNFQ